MTPVRFMETVGIECALWPHLYWKTEMTETWHRSQDKRRLERTQGKQTEAKWVDDAENDDDGEPEGVARGTAPRPAAFHAMSLR